MVNPTLYRKRIIPPECIELKDDIILKCTDDYILTSWNALKPKKDLHHGYSCYFLQKGIKVSKFFRKDHTLLYWYCDIVDYDFRTDTNSLIVTDLLADVIIYPDGFIKVVDLDELAIALEEGSLTIDLLKCSLRTINVLLETIYSGDFQQYQKYIPQ